MGTLPSGEYWGFCIPLEGSQEKQRHSMVVSGVANNVIGMTLRQSGCFLAEALTSQI